MALDDAFTLWQKFRTHVWPSLHSAVFSGVPRRYWKMGPLPEKAGNFSPFFTDDGTEPVWSRDQDLEDFMAQIDANVDTHTILTGRSGSGKSTFLRRVVKPVLGKDLIFNNSYLDLNDAFISKIPAPDHLHAKKIELERDISEFLGSETPPKISISDVLLDSSASQKRLPRELRRIGNRAEAFIQEALAERPGTAYFVFDQIERFLSDLKHLQYQHEEIADAEAKTKHLRKPDKDKARQVAARTLAVYIVIRVFKALRKLENTRTIFAIRSDFLFDSIDFLTYSLDRMKDAHGIFRYYYFNGVTSSEPRAFEQIREQYSTIASPASWPNFVTFTALQSKSVSNTFLTQLSGYMLENFGKSDSNVGEIVSDPKNNSPSDFLEIFFEHLIAGFHQAQKRKERINPDLLPPSRRDGAQEYQMVSHDIFKAVVLTIAVENRTSGDAITELRISRLSHIPLHFITPVVNYLLSRNILKMEKLQEEEYFRFSHDLLFDHVVDSAEFQGRDDGLHKGMERLAEQRVPTQKLIDVVTYGDFLKELRQFKMPAVAMLVYWIFAGALSITSTMQVLPLSDELKKWLPWSQTSCEVMFNAWNRLIDLLPASIKAAFAVTDCASIGYYSSSIAIMHIAWLWYIYKLDRGYFQYAFDGKPGLQRLASLLVPMGTTFGILVGFAPNLSIIPLTVVGLWMSFLLFIVAYQVGTVNPFGRMNRSWATRTTINMVLTAILLVSVHSFVVSSLDVHLAAKHAMEGYIFGWNLTIITFWLSSIFLVWFLMHISPEQQSQISMATRLTQFDVTRHR